MRYRLPGTSIIDSLCYAPCGPYMSMLHEGVASSYAETAIASAASISTYVNGQSSIRLTRDYAPGLSNGIGMDKIKISQGSITLWVLTDFTAVISYKDQLGSHVMPFALEIKGKVLIEAIVAELDLPQSNPSYALSIENGHLRLWTGNGFVSSKKTKSGHAELTPILFASLLADAQNVLGWIESLGLLLAEPEETDGAYYPPLMTWPRTIERQHKHALTQAIRGEFYTLFIEDPSFRDLSPHFHLSAASCERDGHIIYPCVSVVFSNAEGSEFTPLQQELKDRLSRYCHDPKIVPDPRGLCTFVQSDNTVSKRSLAPMLLKLVNFAGPMPTGHEMANLYSLTQDNRARLRI